MNAIWQAPAVVLALLAWLTSPSAGLADIAQREALRRQATPRSQASLTNLGMPPEPVPVSAVSLPPTEVPPATEARPPAAGAAAATPPEPVRDETWWRTKMAEARTTVERGELAAQALQSRINALQADAVNIDDPIRQARARIDLQRALEELDRTTKQLDVDRKTIQALQQEARRLNVPAGWIR